MPEFYLKSPRLEMGGFARFIVRLVSYVVYSSLAASLAVLLFAELRWMQSLGFFILLFLLDRLLHLNEADEQFQYMPRRGKVNLNNYLTPPAFNILEKAGEQAVFVGGNFYLWVYKQALEHSQVHRYLDDWRGKEKKIRQAVRKSIYDSQYRISKAEVLKMSEEIVKKAAEIAINNGGQEITPLELFKAVNFLLKLKEED